MARLFFFRIVSRLTPVNSWTCRWEIPARHGFDAILNDPAQGIFERDAPDNSRTAGEHDFRLYVAERNSKQTVEPPAEFVTQAEGWDMLQLVLFQSLSRILQVPQTISPPAETCQRDAAIERLILRMNCGEYLLLPANPDYNLRRRCGECTSMNFGTGPALPGTARSSPNLSPPSATGRAA
jgi:hypothetical protein